MARRVGLALAAALGLLILLLGAVFALAQTGPGQRLIARAVERALSDPETTVGLEGLSGLVPFDLHLARLTVADRGGVWLELDGLRLAWSPAALLRARIEVQELSAATIRLLRLPPSAPAVDDEPLRLPELPAWVPPVVLDRLAAPRIEVGPDVLGEAATFSLAGRLAARDAGRAAVLALDAARVDRPTARATLDARLELDPAALELTLRAEETGGLLARLTGRPEAGNFTLKLSGAGPLDAWAGDLKLDAERLASADAKLEIALDPQPVAHLDGSVRPAPGLLPEQLAGLIGERLALALTITQTGAQQLSVQDLRATAATAELTGHAELDLERGQLAAAAELRLPDLAPLGAALETPLAGALVAHLVADGALLQPKGRLELRVDAPGIDQIRAERLEATLDLAVLEPAGASAPSLEVSGGGRLQKLSLPEAVPWPAEDVTWRLDLSGSATGPLTLRSLALSAQNLDLKASGTLDPTTLAGRATVGLEAAALGPLTARFGQRIDGGASLNADLGIDAGARRIEVDLTGRARDLAGLPEGLAELLGSAPQLTARGAFSPGERVEVERLTLTGAALNLDGDLALTLPGETLAGRLTVALPKLDLLAPALGVELAGALELEAQPGGSLAAPTVAFQAQSPNLLIAGRAIEGLRLELTAKDLLTAPAGTVALTAGMTGLEAKLGAGFQMQESTLSLAGVRLTAPQASVDGDLAIDLARSLVTGELRGQVGDLAAFAPLLPVRLTGQLKLAARLDPAGQRQGAVLTVDGSQLQSDFGRLRDLRLRARVADAWGTPGIEANLELDAFSQGQIALERTALTARGPLGELALTLSSEGTMPQPVKIDARGGLRLAEPLRLRLEQLDGQLAGLPLRLAQPAELTVAAESLRLTGLDLGLGEARLVATADVGARTVAADLRLDPFPLTLLAPFGGPALTGAARATLRLEGPADQPRGTLEASASAVRGVGLAFAELPPAELTAQAGLAGHRLHVELRAQGLSTQPITLTADLPLVARFDQFVFELPQDGALTGRLEAELALARLVSVAGLDDQTLEGGLKVELGLTGTLGAPDLEGTVAVQDGKYANGATGTVLRALSLRARASGRRLVIERFAATDGGQGTLSGDGALEIDQAADLKVTADLTLKNARLVRRDDVDATLSGALELSGDLAQLKLAGGLTVERANITIPDLPGPSVAVIQVREVGAGRTQADARAPSKSAVPLNLDLTVDLPGRVFVRGRGLESEWQGKLQVTGSIDRPRLIGQLEIKRGYVDFLDRRLELRKGLITFDGATPPDPSISIEAVAQRGSLTAIVRLDGRAMDPKVTLDSDPPLPQDEVLSRLLFDRDTSQISAAQAAQLALALNRLRGGGGVDFMGTVRSLLGVDTLDIGGGGEGAADSTVRAGKYLSDDVYIEVEKGVDEESGKARVGIEVAPNVSVEAETGQDAQGGIGVKWRFDY